METDAVQNDSVKDNDGVENRPTKSTEPWTHPDGGWGWVVCFAAFIETLLYDGVFYSFGMIFLDLTDHFGSNKETGAWISSVNLGICMTIGPLVSALTNRYGFRAVTIAGSWVTVSGLVLSCFATSISYLYVSYGVIAGFGYGMVFSPAILAVTLYFDKKRSLATGLALCGNGLGVFIMTPITELLLKEYTWRGTFLVHAGLLLNGIACGLVFLPLPHYEKTNLRATNRTDSMATIRTDSTTVYHTEEQFVPNGVGGLDTCIPGNDIPKAKSLDMTDTESAESVPKDCSDCSKEDEITIESYQPGKKRIDICKAVLRDTKTLTSMSLKTVRYVLYQTFDMSLLRHPPFCLYTISSALYSLSYYIPFIYIPDVARQVGIQPSKGAWLVSSIGVANILSRIVFGGLTDHPMVNRITCYSVVVFFAGIAVSVVPLISSYEFLLCICISFGLFQGTSAILMTVLVADLLGARDTTQGFGILNLFSGIATVFGSPFAGWLFDYTGNFDLTFYVCGVIVSVSGAMLFVLPCIGCRKNR